jgi:undecaprenyl-diphosphatase
MQFIEMLKAFFIGVVQGITEWLPVSSTGHMILFDEFLKLQGSEEFKEMFMVVIQLGSILAVAFLYFNKLNPFSKKKSAYEKKSTLLLWAKVIVGAIPAAIIGVLLDDWFDTHFYNFLVVAIALLVYGILFIIIERLRKGKEFRVETVDDLSFTDALKIGCFQVLSLIPGTSRSGSTIIGGMLSGVSRIASAEFSFFMAIPIMLGASGLKVLKFMLSGVSITANEIIVLIIGIVVAFLVSLVAIRFLMDFVKRHSFESFGWYRIILSIVILAYFFITK